MKAEPGSRYALALDIGGTHATAAVVDLETRGVLPESVSRRDVDPDGAAEALIDAWAGVVAEAHDRAGQPQGITHIGIAMPGPFDYKLGISYLQHKFASLYGLDVEERLRWGIQRGGSALIDYGLDLGPILFANDAQVYALGEWWAGAGRGHDRVIGLTLGTGLGAGFVAGGRIAKELDDPVSRAELWSMPYQEGIAEDYVSGRAILAEYRRLTGQEAGAREVATRAEAGEEAARAAYRTFGARLGSVLRPSVQRLRPDCIVVGGNIARAFQLFSGAVLAELGPGSPMVVPSTLFEEANLLGAAALGLTEDGRRTDSVLRPPSLPEAEP